MLDFPADPSCCLCLSLALLFDLDGNMETLKSGINVAISPGPSGEELGLTPRAAVGKSNDGVPQ